MELPEKKNQAKRMYMGAWLHMFMVKHCRVHWQRFKTNGMKCKWKRSILATMPALSGIMQKSVFTTHIINCLVAHVQLKIINMSLLRNTDLMPYATSIQWAKLSCTFSVTSRDLKKRKKKKKKILTFSTGTLLLNDSEHVLKHLFVDA